MNIKIIHILLLFIVILLQGCNNQKSSKEYREDLIKIQTRFEECRGAKDIKADDMLCQYSAKWPDEMEEVIDAGLNDPHKLGLIVLNAQQELERLINSDGAKDMKEIQKQKDIVLRAYLVLKMTSSLR